jgi:hypothetical protein
MKITVSRDGTVIGVYERKDIRAAIADGSLNPTDRYFAQGMPAWLPLSTLTKTPGGRTTKSERAPEDQSIPSSAKRAAVSAGYALIIVSALSASLSAHYLSQALAAAAGVILILAARTLP